MATLYSPKIVTDGLVLCLDAADKNSYPGSGTTWYDLSGEGNNGTLTNGPTYSSANGGVIVLDGYNDYILVQLNLSSNLSANQSYTVLGASRYVTAGGRTFSGANNNWLMGHWNTSTVKHYAGAGWVTGDDVDEQEDTNWRFYAATGNYSTDSYAFYVNGELEAGPNTGGSDGPDNFSIGNFAAGDSEYSNSHISFMLCYNRVLTAAEVKQNFEAHRIRFGI